MHRTLRSALLLFSVLLALPAIGQTDGFLVTNTAGDTLFYAAPDGTVLYGPEDARVQVTNSGEGLTSTVTRADGNPSAGIFSVENEANSAVALLGITRGDGTATSGWTFGQGTAGGFYNYDGSNPEPSIETFTVGTGAALAARHLGGDPNATVAEFWTGSGFDETSWDLAARIDAGGAFRGTAGEFRIVDAGNGESPVYARTNGTAAAGAFIVDNPANSATALFSQTNGTGATVRGRALGTGPAIWGDQAGPTGSAGLFQISDAGNGASAVEARTSGTGGAGSFFIDNPANTFSAVFGLTNGGGNGVQGRSSGTGNAVYGLKQSDSGSAGLLEISNADNGHPALVATTAGPGVAVGGDSQGGPGGRFQTFGATATEPALDGVHFGAGAALRAVQNSGGLGGTVAEFVVADNWNNYNTVMRVAADGNVYADGAFNGGGADFAERFEVVGGPMAYEVGDVLAIASSADRHLEKSAEPYSTRILGVYATRPGVLLGDPSIAPETTVPVGVVGVVPTKVTGEGGPIRRGDLLVTSSTPGHAMRGEPGRVGVGMVIGKALQDFDGAYGVIEVMVNVQ